MASHCPGQESRNLKAELVKCWNCGYEAEMFSDESRARCPKCKKFVTREKMPSCVDWCPAAKQCVGDKRYAELIRKGEKRNEK